MIPAMTGGLGAAIAVVILVLLRVLYQVALRRRSEHAVDRRIRLREERARRNHFRGRPDLEIGDVPGPRDGTGS